MGVCTCWSIDTFYRRMRTSKAEEKDSVPEEERLEVRLPTVLSVTLSEVSLARTRILHINFGPCLQVRAPVAFPGLSSNEAP